MISIRSLKEELVASEISNIDVNWKCFFLRKSVCCIWALVLTEFVVSGTRWTCAQPWQSCEKIQRTDIKQKNYVLKILLKILLWVLLIVLYRGQVFKSVVVLVWMFSKCWFVKMTTCIFCEDKEGICLLSVEPDISGHPFLGYHLYVVILY